MFVTLKKLEDIVEYNDIVGDMSKYFTGKPLECEILKYDGKWYDIRFKVDSFWYHKNWILKKSEFDSELDSELDMLFEKGF